MVLTHHLGAPCHWCAEDMSQCLHSRPQWWWWDILPTPPLSCGSSGSLRERCNMTRSLPSFTYYCPLKAGNVSIQVRRDHFFTLNMKSGTTPAWDEPSFKPWIWSDWSILWYRCLCSEFNGNLCNLSQLSICGMCRAYSGRVRSIALTHFRTKLHSCEHS